MENSFFLSSISGEHELYRDLRDNPDGATSKIEFEKLWQIFSKYAPKGFQEKAQRELYQCWWEMYLSIGLLNLNLPINLSSKNAGPDIKILIKDNKTLWIEAVAPKSGNGQDGLPEMLTNGTSNIPEREFLLRLTNAIDNKYGYVNSNKIEGLKKYHHKNIVSKDDIYIIAISSCDLSLYGSFMDFPAPAPLKVLVGMGYLAIGDEKPYSMERTHIEKSNKEPINTKIFYDEQYKYISGILYSNSMILESSKHQYDMPEANFKLFLNPNAINPVPIDLFKGIELWREDSVTERERKWGKIKF